MDAARVRSACVARLLFGRGCIISPDGKQIDSNISEHDRMAERDELARLLRCHDASDARSRDNVAFFRSVRKHGGERSSLHGDEALSNGNAFGLGFFGHIDHVGIALFS